MVRELRMEEQVKMTVEDAGKLFDGSCVFFTNYEKTDGRGFGIPRVISPDAGELNFSELSKKYKHPKIYGELYLVSSVFGRKLNFS